MARQHGIHRRLFALLLFTSAWACGGASATQTPSDQASKVAFVVQPTSVLVGTAISPAVQVALRSSNDITVASATQSVTLTISGGTGTGGALLSGTTARPAVNGIATFDNLSIDKTGTSYTLTATATGLTGATSSAFNVTAATGGTLLLQENFEDASLSARGWYDNTNVLLSTAEHVTGSVSSAQYRFLVGAAGPTSGGSQRHKFTSSTSLYVSYYVKYSANWVGSTKPYHPHEFYALSTLDGDFDGPASNWMTVYLEQNYQSGGKPRMAMQDNKSINTTSGALPNNLVGVTESRSTGGCNGLTETNMVSECFNSGGVWYNDKQLTGPVTFQPTAGPGYKNDWNYVEAYFQLNTVANGVGQSDGIMQYWFNGALIIDRRDILYRTGAHPTMQFAQFLIAPYIGDGSPVDQSMFVDNLRLATARIP